MSDIVETEIELKAEDLDKYVEAAASIAEELRDFLSGHYADITKAHHEPNKWGESLTMPAAYDAPEYAGNIHRLKVACDNFVNAMRGNY
jgi:hypothetical protein